MFEGHRSSANRVNTTWSRLKRNLVCDDAHTDNLNIFVTTHGGERFQLCLNILSTVHEARKKIYDITHIPLNQWRLQSCGGILFWNRRTLSYYDVKD